MEIIDLAEVARLVHRAGGLFVVDNVFATPLLQKPLAFGADVVVYSATKHIDGQGRCLGGVVLADQKFVDELLTPFLRHTGPTLSAFNAWVLLKWLETLDLRVREHVANAAKVADFLAGHRRIRRVLYPGRADHPQHALAMAQMSGAGSLIAFEVEGDRAATFRVVDRLKLIDISNNLGDAKSLITHPETTTHQKLTPQARAELGVTSGLLRLSVGLEDPADLCEDLEQALAAA